MQNIIGIGCDIVQIPRITKIYEEHGDHFLKRIFSEEEIKCIVEKKSDINAYISKRYAAKEAFSKAAGTGIGASFLFNEIEIFSDGKGKPYFSEKTIFKCGKLFDKKNIITYLSLSDDFPTAMAYVIITAS